MSQGRQLVRVARVDIVARDVARLVLVPKGDQPLLEWEPGAHIDVEAPSGVVRQYSLCGEASRLDRYEIAILRTMDGLGSVELHELQPGTELRVSRPRNDFGLRPSNNYLFVAGGIGITPMLAMIAAADQRGDSWQLVYGGRSRSYMAFADELVTAYGDRVRLVAEDEEGLLDLPSILTPRADTLVYCCGPAAMLSAAQTWCDEHWPQGALVLERFDRTSEGQVTTARMPAESRKDDGPLEVQLGPDGPVIVVPADKPILDALVAAGVDMFYSCQEGICGSCETRVLAGEPIHRDDLLTPQEHASGAMLVCVSRARTKRLVLDLEPPD